MCSNKKAPATAATVNEGNALGNSTGNNHTHIVGHLEQPGESTGIHRVMQDGLRLDRDNAVPIWITTEQVRAIHRGEAVLTICPYCIRMHDERYLERLEARQLEEEVRREVALRRAERQRMREEQHRSFR